MAIYAQHGYGKSDKIERGLEAQILSGVVLSPRDESPSNLSSYVSVLRSNFGRRIKLLFDPQFYATTISSGRLGSLPQYPYFSPGLTRARFTAPAAIQQYARETLTYEVSLDLDRFISPSILIADFRDPWSQIALSIAQESMAFHSTIRNARPLLLSLVIDENALRSRDALDEFLDIITGWDVQGFYLLIRRNDTNYQASFEEGILSNLIYFVYALAQVNDFEVVCGYSDLVGIILRAVGAHAIGTGWFNSLRQFSLTRFQPSSGGRAPRPRYTSAPLLNSILVVPELSAVYRVRGLPQVLSGTSYDSALSSGNPANAPWPADVSILHHWEVLERIRETISSRRTVSERLQYVEDRIGEALALYSTLERAGVVFEQATGSRELNVWQRAMRSFRLDISI